MNRLKLYTAWLFTALTISSISVAQDSDVPCTGTQGLVVNFDKETNAIVETKCDSLDNLANYIRSSSPQKFVVIGICTNKEDAANKKNAESRAQRVKEELIKRGVDKNQLSTTFSYFKAPGKNDHHDWPFYPPHYTYEIGVYVQMDF